MIRLSIIVAGIVATSLTHLGGDIMVYWLVSSDLAYTVLLPQLVCVLFADVSNGYGVSAGYLVALVMRVLCGEPLLGIPTTLHFPGCTLEDGVYVQRSPIKTICMLVSLVSILAFSYGASLLFHKGILPERWDVFRVKSQGAPPPADGASGGDNEETAEPMLETKC